MINFDVKIYHFYNFDTFSISGYNYGANHWHLPKVNLYSSSRDINDGVKVSFGYDNDAVNNYSTLWVAIPVNGYMQCDVVGYT